MLTFLKTLSRKLTTRPVAPEVNPTPVVHAAPVPSTPNPQPVSRPKSETGIIPQVAVARLSLLPLLQKLPEDLIGKVIKYPDADVTIALPLSTIQKQLATGKIKMSLASLYRQSPAGTFATQKTEDKRMVELPLS